MTNHLEVFFQRYPYPSAPFMHHQLQEWKVKKPLAGLKVLHHLPIVNNTLLKIQCLIAAGANIVVTNPDFLTPKPSAIAALEKDNVEFVHDFTKLKNKKFDLYFDCGAEAYQALGKPELGAIELTASGDIFYRNQILDFPVISIDKTATKQLETVFGCAENISVSLNKLLKSSVDLNKQTWMIFGFGKIGRGLSYYCKKNNITFYVVDIDLTARQAAKSLGITAINPQEHDQLQQAFQETQIIITATGKENILQNYPKKWFEKKILANMGILDEFGPQFTKDEVLNNKSPINFVLDDPTPIKYIDPELYAHNMAGLDLVNLTLSKGVHDLSNQIDQDIIKRWCDFHNEDIQEMLPWFLKF